MAKIQVNQIIEKGFQYLRDGEPSYIFDNEDLLGVYLPIVEYENLLEQLEDYEDIIAADKAKDEPTISLNELMEKLKLQDELE